jgi:hypothetical protein
MAEIRWIWEAEPQFGWRSCTQPELDDISTHWRSGREQIPSRLSPDSLARRLGSSLLDAVLQIGIPCTYLKSLDVRGCDSKEQGTSPCTLKHLPLPAINLFPPRGLGGKHAIQPSFNLNLSIVVPCLISHFLFDICWTAHAAHNSLLVHI